jgi:hypothetical protein
MGLTVVLGNSRLPIGNDSSFNFLSESLTTILRNDQLRIEQFFIINDRIVNTRGFEISRHLPLILPSKLEKDDHHGQNSSRSSRASPTLETQKTCHSVPGSRKISYSMFVRQFHWKRETQVSSGACSCSRIKHPENI